MDGATVTNYEPNGGVTQVTYTPSAEAVDEFRVEQSNFSAEYGFSGASVVNMITRSGTNSFHGSAYDFIRNQLTDANNWFNDLQGIPLPPVHRHNFGGTIGGPIFKNKTFFFFDYDGTRQSSARKPIRRVFPPWPNAPTATLARCAPRRAGRSMARRCALSPRARSGIPIPASTSPTSKERGRCAARSFPTTASATTRAPEIRSWRARHFSCREGAAT